MKHMKRKAAITLILIVGILAIALLSFGCAPKESADAGGAPEEETPSTAVIEWSPESDCVACHTTELDSTTDAACPASSHATQGLECTTCHTDSDGIRKTHERMNSAEPPTKLKRTKVDNALCDSCHSLSDLAEKTVNSTALTDKEGTIVNPHALPGVEEHTKVACTDCHSMHTETSPAEQAPGVCSTCHHADVYQCYTCHE